MRRGVRKAGKDKKSKKTQKSWFNISNNIDLVVVFAFLVGRLFLNLDFIFSFKALSFFFAVVYMFLILMLLFKQPGFSIIFILFLTVDNMLGTYLLASGLLGNLEFYLTMFINFIIMIIVLKNRDKHFEKKLE